MNFKFLDWFAYLLMMIGAINWGLVGAFGFDFVVWAFGVGTLTTISYIVIGLAGFWGLVTMFRCCKKS
jgi:uncharacterized protein